MRIMPLLKTLSIYLKSGLTRFAGERLKFFIQRNGNGIILYIIPLFLLIYWKTIVGISVEKFHESTALFIAPEIIILAR